MKFDYPYERTIKDENDSAYSVGWEYRRRGMTLGECPYDTTQKQKWFEEGFNDFTDKDLYKFHNLTKQS